MFNLCGIGSSIKREFPTFYHGPVLLSIADNIKTSNELSLAGLVTRLDNFGAGVDLNNSENKDKALIIIKPLNKPDGPCKDDSGWYIGTLSQSNSELPNLPKLENLNIASRCQPNPNQDDHITDIYNGFIGKLNLDLKRLLDDSFKADKASTYVHKVNILDLIKPVNAKPKEKEVDECTRLRKELETINSRWMGDLIAQQDIIDDLEDSFIERSKEVDRLILDVSSKKAVIRTLNINLQKKNSEIKKINKNLLRYLSNGYNLEMPRRSKTNVISSINQALTNEPVFPSLILSASKVNAPFKLIRIIDFNSNTCLKKWGCAPKKFKLDIKNDKLFLIGNILRKINSDTKFCTVCKVNSFAFSSNYNIFRNVGICSTNGDNLLMGIICKSCSNSDKITELV